MLGLPMIARALNRVLRSCDFKVFLNKNCRSPAFLRLNVNRNVLEVFQKKLQ